MENLTYDEFINNILETRGRFACGDEYHERHHIVPRCMGGTNDEDNLIDLFAREHFIAHKLLAEENPNEEGLLYAWWCMSVATNRYTKERYQVTAEEYEEARMAISKIRQRKWLGENNPIHTRDIIGENNPNYGNHKLAGENAPWYGKHLTEEARRKLSEAAKTRTGEKSSNYGNHKLAGKNNPNYGTGKAVVQLTLDGEFIAEYISANEASNITGARATGIRRVCQHGSQSAGGYLWVYKEEYDPKKQYVYCNHSKRRVVQLTMSGDIIAEYESMMEAANTVNTPEPNINRCCRGKMKSAGGFKWMYKEDLEEIQSAENINNKN